MASSKHYFNSELSLPAIASLKDFADENFLDSSAPDAPLTTDYSNLYYFDSVDGLDANDGLTESTPKQTVGALRTRLESLVDGDMVLMKAGSYWQENSVGMLIDGSGTVGGEGVAITSYGTGARPIYSNLFDVVFAAIDITGPETIDNVPLWTIDASAYNIPPRRRLWVDGVEYMGQSPEDDGDVNNWEISDPIDGISTHWGIRGNQAFRTSFDPSGRTLTWHSEDYGFKFINSENIILHGIEIRSGVWKPGTADAGALIISDHCKTFDIRMCEFGYASDGINIRPSTSGNSTHDITVRYNSFDTKYDENHLYNATLKYGRLYYGPSYLEDDTAEGSQSSGRGPVNAITTNYGTYNTLITNNYFRNWEHATIRMYDTGTNTSDVGYPNSRTSGKFMYNDLGGITPYGNRLDMTTDASNWEIAYNIQKGFASNQLSGHSMWLHHNIISGSNHSYFRNANNGEGLTIQNYSGIDPNHIIVENNLFIDCDAAGTYLAFASTDCIIRNNIYYNNDNTPLMRTDASYRGGEGKMNLLIAGKHTDASHAIYNNLIFDTRTTITVTHSTGQDPDTVFNEMTPTELNAYYSSTWFDAQNNIGGDPLFINEVDFKIPITSPAYNAGIEPDALKDFAGIDIAPPYNIGLYNTED